MLLMPWAGPNPAPAGDLRGSLAGCACCRAPATRAADSTRARHPSRPESFGDCRKDRHGARNRKDEHAARAHRGSRTDGNARCRIGRRIAVMSDAFLRNERLLDLLAKRATEGVTSAEQSELDRLLAQYPDADPQLIDRIAAAVMLAGDLPEEPLPASLRARVESQAARELPPPPARSPRSIRALTSGTRRRPDASHGLRPRLAWYSLSSGGGRDCMRLLNRL